MNQFLKKLLLNKIQTQRKPYGYEYPFWVKDFQDNIQAIQAEWKSYIANHGKGYQFDEISKDQVELNKDKMWNVVLIYGYSHFIAKELSNFPVLYKLVKKHQKYITLAMFSTTDARKKIPTHHGNNYGVIRLQIGIDIAEPENCYLRVEDKKVYLKEQETFLFDDTFEHELVNDSKHNRTVLLIDMYRPLPWYYQILNKKMNTELAESEYVQSVLRNLK
ncbi:MAG: aspartyl/asparaginyl beta-hydroxylase domain-containing protein [Chitinophagales bacterium]|nr:aspartyl/asparaginyl beta-hydroxylase domain-containing protein [Chitinophagales bacterium]OJV25973.1 MAG: hypothetical protein BGO32_10495 [Bacteroidetes bacterium 37-13]HRN93160.1 aspartyl/asparaginyl beta-hydroxylase domain-containing protein [Chitinophagales bacterium]HRP38343.1 aspartyl/asparaginyl beta-hydroxylase domain-containing protein [Chitinophagales bacterium]